MAENREATLLIKIKSAGQATFSTISGGLKALGKAALAAGAAMVTYSGAVVAFVSKSEKFNEVKKAFENLTASQGQQADKMLAKMRELSAGTIADMDLMQQANQALMLGLPVERFGDMLEIARSSAKATGQSMEFMLNSIVTGLGRGSKLMLDNLGIVFDVEKAYDEYARTLGKTADELTDAEKKQAFINKALEVGKANAEAAGGSTLSLADRYEQLKTKLLNASIVVGDKLAPAFKVLLQDAGKALDSIETWARSSQATDVFIALTKGVLLFKEAFVAVSEYIGTTAGTIAVLLEGIFSGSATKIQAALVTAAEMYKETTDQLFTNVADNNTRIDQAFADQASKNSAARQKELAEMVKFNKNKQVETKRNYDQELKDRDTFLNTTATLARSNNQTLAAIGKAAAITQIAIKTPEAVASSFAFGTRIGGPALGYALGAIAATAMAAQAAQVAGVQLAEGGIVKARQGGIQATIGEGGQDEAVIPLDRAGELGFGGGSNITIIVNGGMLGDRNSAREFAIAVDKELLELQRNGESKAFEGVV